MQHFGQRAARTLWSCCAGVTSSDALQEARRAERTQLQEQERKKQREERNVRPDCVLCFARRD